MTYEEAIKELEWIYQNGFENDIKIIGTDRILDAIRMGIEAIDKQIPRKPLKEICGDRCPICGSWVWGFTDKREFCGKCSQAIDWSDYK